MSKMTRGQYKGRSRKEHYEWIRENADHFSVFFHQPRFVHETKTFDEALASAKSVFEHYADADRKPNPCLLYAVKGIHSSLIGSYHPITGFKPVLE